MWDEVTYNVPDEDFELKSFEKNYKFVIIRKNIKKVEKFFIKCEEIKIPIKDWEVFRVVFESESAINDISDALVELAGILTGGD